MGYFTKTSGASAATTSDAGTVELATDGETTTGSATDKVMTPSNLTSVTKVGTVTAGTLSTGAVVAGVTMTVGSDATGDVYYRNASGVLTRLGAGDDDQVLTLASGLPSWAAASGGGVDHDAAVTINDSGNDVDFRVESDSKNNMLVVDGGTDRVGIGLHDTGGGVTPSAVLHIATGATGNALCVLVQEDASNKQSIIFCEAGYGNFALQYDGTGSAPANLFKIRSANGADGVIDVDALTVSQVGNIGIGTSTFNASAIGTLALASATAPAAGTSGQCSLYAKDASVDKLLLHFDGADDGTTITDSGVTGHTVTLVGNVHTDTTIKKFGTASAQFDGVGDYLTIPHHTDFDFGTGDYTFDFQIYTTSFAAYVYIMKHWAGSAGWFIRSKITTGDIEFQALGTLHTSTIPLTLDTWHHIAVCRSGTTTRLFVDGVEGFSYSVTEDIAVSQTLYIGGVPGAYYQPGYIDEVRISKGTAHYTAGFTPPVAAHTGAESEAYVLDQNGNETKLSAHNESNEWEFVSKNKNTGKCVKVNMEKMIKRLEELHPGENFLEEWIE